METATLESTKEKNAAVVPPFRKLKTAAKSAGDRGKELAQNLATATKNSDLKKALVTGKHELASKAQHFAHATKVSTKAGRKNLKRALEADHGGRNRKESTSEEPSCSVERPNSTASEHYQEGSTFLHDQAICRIVVASIFAVRNLENWQGLAQNQLPFDLVLTWMLLAFLVGLELDLGFLIAKMKVQILGLEEPQLIEGAKVVSTTSRSESGSGFECMSFLFGQSSRNSKKAQRQKDSATCLSTTQLEKNVAYNINLRDRLSRFGYGRVENTGGYLEGEEAELSNSLPTERMNGLDGVGEACTVKTPTEPEVEVAPLFRYRGLDIFRTDSPENEMATHPYLLQFGLRDCPTLMMNAMTKWGTILVYFEMPSWVQDFQQSLEPSEDDESGVKVLKRFLAGNDNYKKRRLKIMHDVRDAPYPVRMMAPKGSELEVQCDGLVECSYYYYDRIGKQSPILEITVDLMGNAPIRGMASLAKRYLQSISIDIALVVTKPEEQEEDEPEAFLGLFRMDHIDIANYGLLPDRYPAAVESDDGINRTQATTTA